jgi:hypothetical protein
MWTSEADSMVQVSKATVTYSYATQVVVLEALSIDISEGIVI